MKNSFIETISVYEKKKRVNLQYFEGMNLKCNPKFGQRSIYKKVILMDERRRNEFNSFGDAYNFQMGTRRKCSKLLFRVDVT